jgi:hypothetical protein
MSADSYFPIMISGGYYLASKKWQVEDQYGMNEVITKLLVRSRTDAKRETEWH